MKLICKFGSNIVKAVLRGFVVFVCFLVERKGVFSGVFLNGGLVFLGTMVITEDGNTELGITLSVASFIAGIIFSEGRKVCQHYM